MSSWITFTPQNKIFKFVLLAGIMLLFAAPFASGVMAQDAPASNLTDSCIEDFNPDVDYFPNKSEINYADGFEIEYHNSYKVINVLTPWLGAEEGFQYVLLQCGAPEPEGFDDIQIIEIPVNSVVAMSTTQLPHLDQLGLLDHLVGLESFPYVYNENVRKMIDAGDVAAIGYGSDVNVEVALDIDPDLVMAYSAGMPEFDAHPVLLEAGIQTVLNAEWTESSPLGRSEWIKFTGVFFNREAGANTLFDDIVTNYETIMAVAADAEEKPTVFANVPFEGTWYMPGGDGYMAQLIEDAGGNYLWSDDESVTSLFLDFETVFEHAVDADIWLNPGIWTGLEEGLATDERFVEFNAYQSGQVYNNNLRSTESGGSDVYEFGVTNPDLVLADLVKIFHPDLLPDHELFFYQQLQ